MCVFTPQTFADMTSLSRSITSLSKMFHDDEAGESDNEGSIGYLSDHEFPDVLEQDPTPYVCLYMLTWTVSYVYPALLLLLRAWIWERGRGRHLLPLFPSLQIRNPTVGWWTLKHQILLCSASFLLTSFLKQKKIT